MAQFIGKETSIRKLGDADRERARSSIDIGQLLNRLNRTAMGRESMKSCELSACKLLLDKALPDLKSVEVKGSKDTSNLSMLNSHDLVSIITALDLLERTDSGDSHQSSENTHTLELEQNSRNSLKTQDLGGSLPESDPDGLGVSLNQNSAGILRKSTKSESISLVNSSPDLTYPESSAHPEGFADVVESKQRCLIEPSSQEQRAKQNNLKSGCQVLKVTNGTERVKEQNKSSLQDDDLTSETILPENDLEALYDAILEENNGCNTSAGNSEKDETGRKIAGEGVVRGSIIPSKRQHQSGKIR